MKKLILLLFLFMFTFARGQVFTTEKAELDTIIALTGDSIIFNSAFLIGNQKLFKDATTRNNILALDDGCSGISLSIDALNYGNSYLGMWDHSIELVAGTSDSATTILWLQAMRNDKSVLNSISIHSNELVPANSINQHISESKHLFRIGSDSIATITSVGVKLDTLFGLAEDSIFFHSAAIFKELLEVQNKPVNITGINGIDFVPGADVDVDLLTLNGVTGSPKIFWDESQSGFALYTSNAGGRLILNGVSGDDNMIKFFEGAVEKARILSETGGVEEFKFWVGGGYVLDMHTDGEFKHFSQGETDPTVAADSYSFWPEDAYGVAGKTCFNTKSEDGITVVLNQDVGTQGDPTFDDVVVDSIEVGSLVYPDADAGANIGGSGLAFQHIWQDTAHALHYGGHSDFTIGASGENVAFGADTVDILTLIADTLFGDGSNITNIDVSQVEGAYESQSKSMTVESPDGSEDLTMFFTNVAITISEMEAVLANGSATPSVTWTIRHHTDRSNAGNEVVTGGTTTTSVTTGSIVTSFNDATIPVDSWVWCETTAQSGTTPELHITIQYNED